MEKADKDWVKLKIKKSAEKTLDKASKTFASKELFNWAVGVGVACVLGLFGWIGRLHSFW